MSADPARLRTTLSDGIVRLEPLAEHHREPLRTVCAADPAIWEMYFVSFLGEAYDASFDARRHAADACVFAAHADGALVGMMGYLCISARHATLEIGNTYLVPSARGTGLNRRFKDLLLRHAFSCGFNRVEFRVDARNGRSQAAMAKLGAVREGVARSHLITWTGHVRDSAIYSILRDEWPAA